ncbi:MAG: hypothetical protein NTZ17_01075 [Phycisphaerae bacterium]|nr:hypothetical protein [Phycisphaerae bacterium]
MVESVVVTIFPVLFLALLFGGGALLRRRHIDMDGEPPIDRRIFYTSKYAILALWGVTVVQGWGVNLSLVTAPGWLRGIALFLWAGGFLERQGSHLHISQSEYRSKNISMCMSMLCSLRLT